MLLFCHCSITPFCERLKKTGHNFFCPYPYMVQGLFICVSVFWKIMNNFWMDEPNWMKNSGLSRLVAADLRVGSTSAQYPPVTTRPAYSTFPWSLSSQWSWVLLGCVIPFWKAFDKAIHNVREDYLFWTYTCTGGLCRHELQGCHIYFANWPIFHKIDPLKSNSENFLFYVTFSPWGPTASAWPPNRPFTWNASPVWLLVLIRCVTTFWKALDKLSNRLIVDFWFGLVFLR